MSGAVADASIVDDLVRAASDCGGAPALIDHRGQVLLTFAELLDEVPRLAAALSDLGVESGDRVLAMVRRPREVVLLAGAVLWAGGTLVFPPRTRNWATALRAAGAASPRAVVAESLLWPFIASENGLRSAPVRICAGPVPIPGTRLLRSTRTPTISAPTRRGADEAALISFTSGTTGAPKLVTRTHGVLGAQHRALSALRGLGPEALDLAGLPLLVLHDIAAGVTCVLPPPGRLSDRRFATALRETLRGLPISSAAGFPSLFAGLLDVAGSSDFPALQSLYLGGAVAQPSLLHALSRVAPGAKQVIVYGCTEAEPVAAIEGDAYLHAWADKQAGHGICVGRPTCQTEVRLAPLPEWGSDRRTELDVGRVLIRGPQVATACPDAWHDTGDLGWMDAAGCLWLFGRAANLVAGGPLPAEVEISVESLPWVAAAALVAVPSPIGPQAVLAVEPRRDAPRNADALRCELAELAERKGWALQRIVLVHSLPRDARSGSKIDYLRLAESLES